MSQKRFTAMQVMATSTVTPDRSTSTTVIRKTYPNYKVIVLNDDFNSFDNVDEVFFVILGSFIIQLFPLVTK